MPNLTRDESVPLPNKMDQEIPSAINRALFNLKELAHIWIMNAKSNANSAIMAITNQKAKVAMALVYHDTIIDAACRVDKGVTAVAETKSCERLKVHAVPLMRYMGKGTEG